MKTLLLLLLCTAWPSEASPVGQGSPSTPHTPVAATASWYGEAYRGKPMANGRPFNPAAFTCASWLHPLGTRLRVSCGNRSIVVVVTDRGPAWRLISTRQIDLSEAAFRALSDPSRGLIPVSIVPVR